MKRSQSPGERNGGARQPDDLERLRELLVGPEQEQIAGLRERLDDPAERTRDLSRTLPHAIRLSTSRDDQLSQALASTVESALKQSIRKDPRVLTDVVFPVIGPAIRKAIAEAFGRMLQTLNQTLEHSLSVQGLKWRIEALRTGRSFAEVVLSRTLIYRVEQVFLIHRESGLLLQHVQATNIAPQDPEMISGMLTGIQDFARDSFRVSQGETLETLKVGDINVWVESSPSLILAAAIRGVAPLEFRATMQYALERITIEQGPALEVFQGDAAPFVAARPVLEDCLRLQLAERRPASRTLPWLLFFLFIALAVCGWSFLELRRVDRRAAQERELVEQQQQRHAANRRARAEQQRLREEEARQREALAIEEARRAKLTKRLQEEEGFVVTETVARDGKFHVAGLRDPLAAEPQQFVTESGFDPAEVVMRWEAYYALTPSIILRRATQRLQPPETVTLELRGDALVAKGSATTAWIASAHRRAESIPGVATFDAGGVLDEMTQHFAARKKEIEDTFIFFGEGVQLAADDEAAVHRLAKQMADLRKAARQSGRRLRVTVIGHTTTVGTEEFNLKLSRERADQVISLLVANGVEAAILSPLGVASRELKYPDTPENVDVRNRRVSFAIAFDDAPLP